MGKSKLFLLVALLMVSIPAAAKNIPLWWNVSPSDGTTVDELSVIKIDNDGYSDTFRAEEGISLLINDKAVKYSVSYENNYGYPDDTIVITLNSPITAGGEYTINMPAGFFTYLYYGEDLSVSEEFEWTVTVQSDNEDNPGDFKTSIPSGFSVKPADGATVASITSLTISDSNMENEAFEAKKASFDILINGESVSVTASTTDTSITMTLTEAITLEGSYNIEVPAGTFTYEDFYWNTKENQAFRWTVKVAGENPENPDEPKEPEKTVIPSGFKVTPEDGAVVEALSQISVTNSILGELEFNEGAELYINGKSVGFTPEVTSDEETLLLTLAEPCEEEGTYSIFLPKGFFTYYGDIVSSDFKWSVTVGEGEDPDPKPDDKPTATIPTNFKVSPDNGATVEKIEEIVIESTRLGEFGLVDGSILYINGESAEYTASISGYDDEILTLTLTNPITDAGAYSINLPAGFFTFYDETFESGEFLWTVNVDENETPDEPVPGETTIPDGFHVSPAPDSEVDAINIITITTDYSDIMLPNPLTRIIINNNPTSVSASANWDKLVITLDSEITEPGQYTIVIPAGSFRWADIAYEDSDLFLFTLNIKAKGPDVGVKGVNIDNEDMEIYTLDGQRVNEMLAGKIYIMKSGDTRIKVISR